MATAEAVLPTRPAEGLEGNEGIEVEAAVAAGGEILETNGSDQHDAAAAANGVSSGSDHQNGPLPPPPAKPHPLEHSWTFWFDNPSSKNKQAPWGSSIRPIHTFSTVEDFWSLYNNINRPSKLVMGADFHCFKYRIEPKWEDPVCANGGKWTISCVRGKADTWWLHTLLAMIGEQFDHGDEICGAVVNVRGKQDKIALWTKHASNEAAQISIGRQWKEFLDYNETIGFIFHEDAKRHERSARNRYVIP